MKKVWAYLEPTILGSDGLTSQKRLMAFIAFFVIIGLCVWGANTHFETSLITLTGMFTALVGITAVQTMKTPPPPPNDPPQ